MKMILCLVLSVLMFCFAGCASSSPETVEPTVTTEYVSGQLVETIKNADGSYIKNIYIDGTLLNTKEFNKDDALTRWTVYAQDGSVLRVEKYEYTDDGTTRIVVDANGIETEREENYTETYDGGKRTIHKVTKNGIVTLLSSTDEKSSGLTIKIEERATENSSSKKLWTIGGKFESRYSMSEVIESGKLIEYSCERDFREGAVPTRRITYLPETNMYELVETTVLNWAAGYIDDVITLIPAEEYIRADWERFEQ